MRSLFLLALPLLLAALSCGSGSGSVAVGGVGGSGLSLGPVTDFGSIFVTGIEWDVDTAGVLVDGTLGTEADIELGMIVRVDGTLDLGLITGIADRVIVDENVEGPISALTLNVDGTVATLEVLGSTVFATDGSTVFGDSMGAPYDFADLAIDDVVEVFGFVDENGDIRATRIEMQGVKDPNFMTTLVTLSGMVINLVTGPGGSTFDIGIVTVTTDGSTITGEIPSGLMDGLNVKVAGVLTADNAVLADEITPNDNSLPDGENVEIEGVITSFTSLAVMEVNGFPVDASIANRDPFDSALYVEGAVVEVEGDVVGGVLLADNIELRGFDVRVSAELDNTFDPVLSVNTGRLSLLGILIQTDASTQFRDEQSGAPDELLELADLASGDFIEVRGVETDGGLMRATRLERTDTDDVELRAFVQASDAGAGTLTFFGIPFDVNGADFEDEDDVPFTTQADFFAAVATGDLVELTDDIDSDQTAIDIADQVELETPESGTPALPPTFFPGVPPVQSTPSAAALMNELGVFDAPPPDPLQATGELFADTGPLEPGVVVAGEREERNEASETDGTMVEAVRLFFARIGEVASRPAKDSDAPRKADGEAITPGE